MTTTQPQTLTAGQWVVDPAASTASFGVGNLGRTVRGTVPVLDGTIEVDDSGTLTAVRGSLDLGSIDTGHPKRDKDLRKTNLLDLDAYPTMSFTATTITANGHGWHVAGELTVRGFVCPIEGDVRMSTTDSGVSMTATAKFDRRHIGLRAPRFLIGRVIDITVTASLRHA